MNLSKIFAGSLRVCLFCAYYKQVEFESIGKATCKVKEIVEAPQ